MRIFQNNQVSLLAFLWLVLALCPSSATAGEVFKWKDKDGNVNYSDSLSGVPPQYRDQVTVKEFKEKKKVPGQAPPSRRGALPGSEMLGERAEKLKTFVVPYRAYVGTSRRIIINVKFNGSVTAPMLLDTGAPGMVLFHSLAERLGVFDSNSAKLMVKAGGIGGQVPAVLTIIDKIEVGGAVSEFNPATIVPSMKTAFEGLVGMEFMANYQMQIDSRRRVLIFQELPNQEARPGGHDEEWWRITFYEFAARREGWKQYLEKSKAAGGRGDDFAKMAEKQYSEASRLLNKLDSYASRNSVPMSWRRY